MAAGKKDFAPWLGVFETVRVSEGVPLFVAEHFAEFERAAQALGLRSRLNLLTARARLPRRSGRWRWIATPKETRTFFVAEKTAAAGPVELSVSPVRLGSHNWDARFKTLSYLAHAQALQAAVTREVVLLNEHREIASAARGNLFWRRGERLFTPAHEAGCRRGVVRGFVLARREVEEGRFPLEDLLAAEEIFVTNSMRGIVSVRAIEGRKVGSTASAGKLRREYQAEVERQRAGKR